MSTPKLISTPSLQSTPRKFVQKILQLFTYKDRNIPKGTAPTLDAIDGAVAPVAVSAAGAESNLDFQIAYPIIYPQKAVLFQTDDPVYENNYVFEGFLNTFLDALDGSYCSTVDPLDPKYPDTSTKTGAYKGALQCGVYKPVSVSILFLLSCC